MTPHDLDASEAATLIRAGRLTAVRLLESCLERIASRENEVHAWTALDAARALAAARDCDARPPAGLLHGLPIGVKDVIDTADLPTAYGSPIYQGHRPRADAACVALLRAEGAFVLGKTVTAEFATSFPGPTRNPWNTAHTPGGSSSGSAAAVADRMVPLACGTQTAGSIVRPAAFCGVVGFKPTFGWTSRQGVKQVAESLDTLGSFGRSVTDAALMAAAMAKRPSFMQAAAVPVAPQRVTVVRTDAADEAQPEAWSALETVAQRLSASGACVRRAELPTPCQRLGEIHPQIEHFEAARALAFEHASAPAQLSERLRTRLEHGLSQPEAIYRAACAVAAECRAAVACWVRDQGVLLTPSATGEAPAGLATTGSAAFNRRWSLLGLPCLSMPVMAGPNGLPVGVQLVAPWHAEGALLAAAVWIEQMLGRPRFADDVTRRARASPRSDAPTRSVGD
ncbi:MAG: amidase [Proteobacteria bacterium]|nr:amidase [Burkholderiales bacterium]